MFPKKFRKRSKSENRFSGRGVLGGSPKKGRSLSFLGRTFRGSTTGTGAGLGLGAGAGSFWAGGGVVKGAGLFAGVSGGVSACPELVEEGGVGIGRGEGASSGGGGGAFGGGFTFSKSVLLFVRSYPPAGSTGTIVKRMFSLYELVVLKKKVWVPFRGRSLVNA